MHRFLFSAMLLFALPAFAQQNPNGVIPIHTSNQPYLFLVRDPIVHEAAQLTAIQKQKLQVLNERLDLPLWSMRNKGPAGLTKIMTQVLQETKTELPKILEPQQVNRIQQIEYWVLGVKSLLRQEVASHVGLAADQQSTIREIIVDAQSRLATLQKDLQAGGDPQKLNERWGEVQQQQRKDAIAVLSNDQQQTFRAMLGDQVKVAKLGRIKMKVPDFDSSSKWINSEPLTLDKLKGKVVALHFYAFA